MVALLPFALTLSCANGPEPFDVDAGVRAQSAPVSADSQSSSGTFDATAAFDRAARLAAPVEPWLAGALRQQSEGIRLDGGRFRARGRASEGVIEGDLSLSAAVDFQEGFTVGVGGGVRFDARFRPIGGRSVQGVLSDARAAWHDAWPSTDVLLVAGAQFAEVALLLRDAAAPSSFSFTVGLPRSLRDGGLDAGGNLRLLDTKGEPVLRVRAPFAIDAVGKKRGVTLSLVDGVMRLELDRNGLTYPILVDPTVDRPVWRLAKSTEPLNPEGPLVVPYAGTKVYAVNGTNLESYPAATRVFDPTPFATFPWTNLAAGGPAGRRYGGGGINLANQIVVFGGWTGTCNNTWSWYDGTSWTADTALSVGGSIAGRVGMTGSGVKVCNEKVIACSDYDDPIVLFGGNCGSTTYTDVLKFQGGVGGGWTRETPSAASGAPVGRSEHYFVGNLTGSIVLASGLDTSVAGYARPADTWRLQFTRFGSTRTSAWVPVCGTGGTAACPFVGRSSPAGGFDPTRKRHLMFGGTTSAGANGEMYEFSTATDTWTAICGTASTPTCLDSATGTITVLPRYGAGLACLKGTTKTSCYMLGGVRSGTMVTETWEYSVRGNACATNGECDTGNCVDGACCTTTACGGCQACNLAGSEGVCSYVKKGDAGGGCSGASACDGAGGCLLTQGQACTLDTQCLSGFCADGYCCNTACAGRCDACATLKGASANGTCTVLSKGAAGEPSCSPAVCDGVSSTCPGACTKDGDCSTGSYCASDGKCKTKKVTGALCNPAVDCVGGSCGVCASGFCTDGVCCDAACDGLCQACSKARKGTVVEDGKCAYAADGEPDSKARCTDSGTGADTGCKTDGKCGGAGACRYYSKTTSCGGGGATCVGNSASGRFCDGTGTCAASGSTSDCAPFKCVDGVGCPSTCAKDTDCVVSAYCDAGVCKPKLLSGISCLDNRECDSGVCSDGNCCDRPCTGLCEACNTKGYEGKCVLIVGAPLAGHGSCPAGDPTKPCDAPTCDGTVRDKCVGQPGADIVCRERACKDGTATPEGRCAKGECKGDAPRSCAPYACALDGCKDKCTTNADCASPSTCDVASGKCVNAGRCEPDGYTAVSGDGATRTDCRPFKCEASGKCRKPCATTDDCFAPNLCDTTSGTCVAPPESASADSGGCALGSTSRGGTHLGALLGLLMIAGVARRRGRRIGRA